MRNTSLRLAQPAPIVQTGRISGVHRRQDGFIGVLPQTQPGMMPVRAFAPQAPAMPVIVQPAALAHVHAHVAVPQPSAVSRGAARAAVSIYRLIGFSILTVIVVLLLSFITSTAFFFFSHTWVMPIALTPGDTKVVAMQTELAARQNARDALAVQLKQADLDVAMQQRYQLAFVATVKSDLAHRRAHLAALHDLANSAGSASAGITATSGAYAAAHQAMLDKELEAGLVRRDDMMTGNYENAQIQTSTLGLQERQADLEQRASDLGRETASLDAILASKQTGEALAYDVLQIKQQYEASKLALGNAERAREMVKRAVEREDAIIDTLKSSVYVKAMTDKAMIAYVPYDNLQNAKKDAPLYRCKIGMVLCHQVGKVLEVLPGEVMFQHPHRDRQVRGQAVELVFDDGDTGAAQDDVLFVGGKPMWI